MTRLKECKIKKLIFGILHFLLMLGPIVGFAIYGFATSEASSQVSFILTAIGALIVAIFSALVAVKHRAGLHRTIMWLLIIGILFMLNEIKSFIWIVAITAIVDEIVISKLYDKYCNLVTINKEISNNA